MDSIDNNNETIECKLDGIEDDFLEQRVKVDRKKFEQIINGKEAKMMTTLLFFIFHSFI